MKTNPQIYYKDALIECPPDITHRHIRLKKGDKWIKLFRVKNLNELRKYLIRFTPDAVYVSVSCYLEPELVSTKWKQKPSKYKILPNIILSSDFVMDFDDGRVKSMNEMLKAYKFLRELGHDKFKAVITKRGFHLWDLAFYEQECHKNIPHKPFAREIFILSKKKELCAELNSIGIKFDMPISIDTRRIVKLWGSLTDNNFICKAYDNPQILAKEIIQSSYLPNNTETKRGQLADVAQ
jgi:DNA primase catalytic subunit